MIALVIALAVDLPDVTASGVTTDLEVGDAEPAAGFWFELAGALVMTAGAAVLRRCGPAGAMPGERAPERRPDGARRPCCRRSTKRR